jgi:hypothetical protein
MGLFRACAPGTPASWTVSAESPAATTPGPRGSSGCGIRRGALAGLVSRNLGVFVRRLLNRAGDGFDHDPHGADRVIVPRDRHRDDIGIGVGVHDGHHRDSQLVGLRHRDLFALDVNHEHRLGPLPHGADAAQAQLQLLQLAREPQGLFLGEPVPLALVARALQRCAVGGDFALEFDKASWFSHFVPPQEACRPQSADFRPQAFSMH